MLDDVSALAKAASVAALSPSRCTKQMLSGQSSQTRGAPGLLASAVDDDRGQRLVVDLDQLGGVHRLVRSVSATTKAT